MVIQCDKCHTKFHLDETRIGTGGTRVRCSRCRHVFVAHPPEPVASREQETMLVSDEGPGLSETGAGETSGPDIMFKEESMVDIKAVEAEKRKGTAESRGDGPKDAFSGKSREPEEKPPAQTGVRQGADRKKDFCRSYTWVVVSVIILGLVAAGYVVVSHSPGLAPAFLAFTGNIQADKPDAADTGARRLEILTVNGFFVETEHSGRLFVIRGKVRNNYPRSRRYILVKGRILDNRGQLVREKTAYAGNKLDEHDLKTLSLEEINTRMKNRHGSSDTNMDVEPGTAVDFVIVFENLPDNLSEFTVGAISSSPGNSVTGEQG
ncbi:MAG: hypothetical protein DRH37_02940 [Deltaproteobacteria bacterium]|nr:MAG: hypothetical protein DRH37_02940 [Deltaproteobacteria bacterium]